MSAFISTRRAVLAGAASGVGLAGCGLVADILRYRFSMDVEVEGVVHSASAVQGFLHREPMPGMGTIDIGEGRTVGEALVVDLGTRGVMFATLAEWRPNQAGIPVARATEWVVSRKVRESLPQRPPPEFILDFYRGLKVGTPVDLTPDLLPVLVTFRDYADSRSVVAVDPVNLAATFGSGVRLVRAWVEGANGFINRGSIKKILPWIDESGSPFLSQMPTQKTNSLADCLSKRSFVGR